MNLERLKLADYQANAAFCFQERLKAWECRLKAALGRGPIRCVMLDDNASSLKDLSHLQSAQVRSMCQITHPHSQGHNDPSGGPFMRNRAPEVTTDCAMEKLASISFR